MGRNNTGDRSIEGLLALKRLIVVDVVCGFGGDTVTLLRARGAAG